MSDYPAASDSRGLAPFALAMLICDSIHRDPATGKFTILGTFSSIAAKDYPARATFSVYIAITDGRGKIPLQVRLVSVDEDAILFEGDLEVDFSADPRIVFELAIGIGNLEIPKEGEYRVQMFSGSEHVMERRLVALRIPVKGQ